MWIVAWTINLGNNNLPDYWIVVDTEAEAEAEVEALIEAEDNLHCWAIAPIKRGSEPHFTEE